MRTALLLLLAALPLAADETFGFRGFEIYKLDPQIERLVPADVDGDGLMDLLIANNSRAKIEVMLRRKTPVQPKAKTGEKPQNELVDDRFFERKEILTEKSVWSLVPADLNGDGKVDVAYYGKPEELVVAYGDGAGAFPTSTTFAIGDGAPSSSGLAAGDLDGDGRADLVLLAKGYSAIFRQSAQGKLQEPSKVPHSEKDIHAVRIRDMDGDGRQDLIHLVSQSARSVRVRYQRADGTLGAEFAFETTPWRGLAIEDVDPAPGAEILVVQRNSGVFRALRFEDAAAADALALGGVEIHAFEESTAKKARSMAVGDVNGDGKADVVVTEPGTAQVAVYLQDAGGGLHDRALFPSLAESDAVRVADLDGDGKGEVVVLSITESAVGVSSLQADGRLPFPTMLSHEGTPKAIDTGDLDGDGRMDLVVVAEKDKAKIALLFLQTGGPPRVVPLEGLKDPPDDCLVMDFDQDGRADLLLFDRFGPMRVWRAAEAGYEDVSAKDPNYRGGLVQKIGRQQANPCDIDGDGKAELLVATKNFARALRIAPGEGIAVRDQANGSSPRSEVQGAVALDLDADGKPEVALFDAEKNVVSILARDEKGVFAITGTVPVGGNLDFRAIFAADLNGDGRPDLVVQGKNRFGVLHASGGDRRLKELHAIENSRRDTRLEDFAVGDLNGDGKPDVAAIDGGNLGLQVFGYDPEKGFSEELAFPVYERKLHQDRNESGLREIAIADFDGDGRMDLALLVHDRLIVYPQ